MSVENSHLITRHDESEAHDDNVGMITLVRPSMLPDDTQMSPSRQIMGLQPCILKANNRVYELETENREITEAMKDLRIQVNITTDLLEEFKNQSNRTRPAEPGNQSAKQKPKLSKSTYSEPQNRITELENECEDKTKEIQRLSTEVSNLENKYLSTREEN